jgi:hypothetical protein
MNTTRITSRSGSILVLTVMSMILMFAMLAFAVDIGYLSMVRTELQRTADATAIAAAGSLLDGEVASGLTNSTSAVSSALGTADQFAHMNKVMNTQPSLSTSDVVVGYLSNPSDPNIPLNASSVYGYNAVQVRVRRTTDQNGAIPLFFARVLGIDQKGSQARATAAFLNNISGFRAPADGSNLQILPMALKQETWDALMAGQGTDNYSYDPDSQRVNRRADGIKEVNLYPESIDSPGNSGTIDIGSPNNSTTDVSRQIEQGINLHDLSYLGGKITVPGTFNGDTGMSAGIKDNLASIKGLPRILPLYSDVVNPGNTAQFTIVRFVGVRILDVKLNASMNIKHVTIQPAQVFTEGAIPSTSGDRSDYIFSRIWLVR